MFHVLHDGETAGGRPPGSTGNPTVKHMLSDLDLGIFVGLLIGEGHFGGDGRQAQITLRMHTDHESLFRWIAARFPGGRLYGPYEHGGRRYFQWMARGPYLREVLVPLLDQYLHPDLDQKSFARFSAMKQRYRLGSLPPAPL
jgi:hypothetical protein